MRYRYPSRIQAATLVSFVLTWAILPNGAQAQERSVPALPEQSLSKWYKPVNDRQVWLHTMFSLRRELQAVRQYAEQKDQRLLAKWTARLTSNYRKIGEMVPEWSEELELDNATALEVAAADGDFAAATRAARRLGHTCDGCHNDYRALTAARFRTPDFGTIEIRDASGRTRRHDEHMELLSHTLNEIKIASEDSRWEAALDAEDRLRTLLTDLGASCESCHRDDEPRQRILGPDPQQSLDELHNALTAQSEKDTGRYLGTAAVQICARCHGVHRTLYDLRTSLFP